MLYTLTLVRLTVKILAQNSGPLLAFLHLQGVIRDEKDLSMLGDQFKDAYTQRQVDPFDETGWNNK